MDQQPDRCANPPDASACWQRQLIGESRKSSLPSADLRVRGCLLDLITQEVSAGEDNNVEPCRSSTAVLNWN
eukprot:scaffold8090_cov36-Prasinocladus_malaysianus.AAC.1